MNNLKNVFLTPRVEELKSSYLQDSKYESLKFLAELLKYYILANSDSPRSFCINGHFDSDIVSEVMKDLGFSQKDYEGITYYQNFIVINFFYS